MLSLSLESNPKLVVKDLFVVNKFIAEVKFDLFTQNENVASRSFAMAPRLRESCALLLARKRSDWLMVYALDERRSAFAEPGTIMGHFTSL